MKTKRPKPDFQMIPLRVPGDMAKRIRIISEKNHLSDADVMRLAIERGFAAVERMFESPEKQAA